MSHSTGSVSIFIRRGQSGDEGVFVVSEEKSNHAVISGFLNRGKKGLQFLRLILVKLLQNMRHQKVF